MPVIFMLLTYPTVSRVDSARRELRKLPPAKSYQLAHVRGIRRQPMRFGRVNWQWNLGKNERGSPFRPMTRFDRTTPL